MNRPGICYFLLNYRRDTHRHYYHIYEFIDALAERSDLRLLIKECMDPPDFKHPVRVEDLSGSGLRARLRRNWALWRAWRDGYRVFYHHYTTAPARFCALMTRLLGGKTYLWHCIVMQALDSMLKAKPWHRWLLKSTFHLVDHPVTGSGAMADYYAALYGIRRDRIRVVPNYINLKRFDAALYDPPRIRKQLGIPDGFRVILYLHELEEGRAKRLAPIVHEIMTRRNDAMFLIAGDGRYRGFLERELAPYVSKGRVRFEGRVANLKAPEYYAAADVYLMTSDFEAFSRVLLESMAMGTPYVATDGGGTIRAYTPESHQPFILPIQDVNRFPDLIEQLLDDQTLHAEISRAGLEHVQNYSMDRILDIFLETMVP